MCPAPATPALPAYLAGRFGPRAVVRLVEADDGQAFEVGCLAQLQADHTDPLTAVGVVFAPAPPGRRGALAIISKAAAEVTRLVVRDGASSVSVRLVDPLAPIEKPVAMAPGVVAPPTIDGGPAGGGAPVAAAPRPASGAPRTIEEALAAAAPVDADARAAGTSPIAEAPAAAAQSLARTANGEAADVTVAGRHEAGREAQSSVDVAGAAPATPSA